MNIDIIIQLNQNKYTLEKVLEICQPGDIIEGISVDLFDDLMFLLEEKRNKTYGYFTDRRYGKWRMILTGKRDSNIY